MGWDSKKNLPKKRYTSRGLKLTKLSVHPVFPFSSIFWYLSTSEGPLKRMELTITPTKTHNLKEVTYDTRPLPMTQISEELSNLWNYSYDITWKRYALDNTIMIPMVTFTLVGGSWLGRWLTYTQVVVWVQILTSSFTYMGSSKKDVCALWTKWQPEKNPVELN
jgi:hypothetical protein